MDDLDWRDKTRLLVLGLIVLGVGGGWLLSLIFSSSSLPVEVNRITSEEETTFYEERVHRVVDEEAGVACWLYNNTYNGGIDCLPIGETRLEKGRGR